MRVEFEKGLNSLIVELNSEDTRYLEENTGQRHIPNAHKIKVSECRNFEESAISAVDSQSNIKVYVTLNSKDEMFLQSTELKRGVQIIYPSGNGKREYKINLSGKAHLCILLLPYVEFPLPEGNLIFKLNRGK